MIQLHLVGWFVNSMSELFGLFLGSALPLLTLPPHIVPLPLPPAVKPLLV